MFVDRRGGTGSRLERGIRDGSFWPSFPIRSGADARLTAMTCTYWLDVFTVETWHEFRQHGGNVSGFPKARVKTVKRMQEGCPISRVAPAR